MKIIKWSPTVHWVSWYKTEFNEEVSIRPETGEGIYVSNGRDPSLPGLLAKRFINGSIWDLPCNTTFGDPTQFVLNRLREMAFRTAVGAAAAEPNLLFGEPFEEANAKVVEEGLSLTRNWTQSIDVIGQRRVVAYAVSMPYLACAIVFSLLAVGSIAPLYWTSKGDETFTRSFNPLDTAQVFDAPLLQDVFEKDMDGYVRKDHGLRRVKCAEHAAVQNNDMVARRMVSDDR
ncbi:hypothetical protein N0V95_007052 [Ascochyta clinopodiicola]|nr:hypothetical protein N0V95_007052 [Ascochyta clinopodiicola]